MGISESQGEGHERFIRICPKPFTATKDCSACDDEDLGLGGVGIGRKGAVWGSAFGLAPLEIPGV